MYYKIQDIELLVIVKVLKNKYYYLGNYNNEVLVLTNHNKLH